MRRLLGAFVLSLAALILTAGLTAGGASAGDRHEGRGFHDRPSYGWHDRDFRRDRHHRFERRFHHRFDKRHHRFGHRKFHFRHYGYRGYPYRYAPYGHYRGYGRPSGFVIIIR